MPFCQNCRIEYRSEFTHCADCGEQLIEKFIEKCAVCKKDLWEDGHKICDICHQLKCKSNKWIKTTKIFTWIAFGLIIIYGILEGVLWKPHSRHYWHPPYYPEKDFLTVAITIIVAFLLVGVIIIILDMARDIKTIRSNTQKKD